MNVEEGKGGRYTSLGNYALLTPAQLDPATRQDTSPPSFLAAVIALRVMGLMVLLSCSATTSVDCKRLTPPYREIINIRVKIMI